MYQNLLIKEIRLMLKDLKFQIFFLILVVLFILSAISTAVTYQNLSDEYQNDVIKHNERVSHWDNKGLINMLQNNNLLDVLSRPSPALLFSSFSSHPDKITTGVIHYSPTFSKYGSTGNDVFRLNWFFILGILSGFIMLILSFEAISSEKRAGTLRLLSIYGFKRQTILWHKYICYMLLYLIIIIPPALISMILFFSLTGTWSVTFMLKYLLILLISIPFASFFTLLGIFISMLKNYRNAIVIVIFFWLLFSIIIPQSAKLLSKRIAPLKKNIEYRDMRTSAFWNEFNVWRDEYEDSVSGNSRVYDGLRAKAVSSANEKMYLITEMELADSKRQTLIKQNIASLSPFIQFEKIAEVIFDKGFYLLEHQQANARRSITQIRNLMIEQDSRDPASMNLFYSWARGDFNPPLHNGKETFSREEFEHPTLLLVTDIPTDDVASKTLKILLRLLPILLLNIILIVCSVVKLERLDIR